MALALLPGQKRSLMDILSQQVQPEASANPQFLPPTPEASPNPDSLPATFGVDFGAMQDQPLSSRPPLPGQPGYADGGPKSPGGPLPKLSDAIKAQLDATNAPPSRKGTLLKLVSSLAPIAAGAAFGGTGAAYGAAQGEQEYNATQAGLLAQKKKDLQTQYEDQANREERGQERQETVDAQIQGVQQRAQAAIDRAQSAEEVANIRADTQRQIGQLRDQIQQGSQDIGLRKIGMKKDAEGHIVPLDASEMSDTEQAAIDYKKSLSDLAEARRQVEIAKNNPDSPMFRLAQQRAANAEKSASTAASRLGLSQQQFEMRAFGTNNGEALPGTMIGDDGKPIGSSFQQNVRPTGTERNKADLASSAHDQISDLKSIVQARPDIFGPAAGRKTDFDVWVGSQDPDAQRYRAARTIAGDHLAGVFGGRSEAALSALDSAIGKFKDNPDAVLAGLDQLDKANSRFVKAGTVKTTGSNAAPKKPAPGSLLNAVRPPLSSFDKP